MPDIRIQREHHLGLDGARRLARQWVAEASRRFELECTTTEGADGDVVEFKRSGLAGRMEVTADRIDLQARLGLLLGGFAKKIEGEIAKNLDALLAAPPRA